MRFDRIFDEAYFAPAGYMSPAVEVLLIDKLAAMVLVRVAFSAHVTASVGYATVEPDSVQRIVDALQWDSTKARGTECWNKPRQKADDDDDARIETEFDAS
jgi:hypothetical protein